MTALADAEQYARQVADCDDERDWLPALLAEYDRRGGELEQTAWERDTALVRVAAAEAVQSRMADSLPDQGPWQAWSERDRAVRDYEGELSTALSTEIDPAADRRIEADGVEAATGKCGMCEIAWQLCRGLYDKGLPRCCSDCTHDLDQAGRR
jgi:hypothetical protein